MIEKLSDIACNDNAETVKKELNEYIVTLIHAWLNARPRDSEKVRLGLCMHEMHWEDCCPE